MVARWSSAPTKDLPVTPPSVPRRSPPSPRPPPPPRSRPSRPRSPRCPPTPPRHRGPPTFTRIDVDTAISGASFTSVGEVFAGEQDIVTSGYGALTRAGRPVGGGSLQLYRPGATLEDWTKVRSSAPTRARLPQRHHDRRRRRGRRQRHHRAVRLLLRHRPRAPTSRAAPPARSPGGRTAGREHAVRAAHVVIRARPAPTTASSSSTSTTTASRTSSASSEEAEDAGDRRPTTWSRPSSSRARGDRHVRGTG